MNLHHKPVSELTEWEIMLLYREWSEASYCGFIVPSTETVKEFRNELHLNETDDAEPYRELYDYEMRMLQEFKKQEKEDLIA